MNCKNCNISEFVFADLYCQDCPDKPKPRTIKGRAYLHQNNKFAPVKSVDITALEGSEYLVSAIELLKDHRIKFISEEAKNV